MARRHTTSGHTSRQLPWEASPVLLSTDRRAEHYCLISGVASYREDSGLKDLPSVSGDLEQMHRLLTDRLGARAVAKLADPTREQIVGALKGWLHSEDRTSGDVLTWYHSGHGGAIDDQNGAVLLFTSDYDGTDGETALTLAEVLDMIARQNRVRDVLIIVDCCFAEAAALQAASLVRALTGGRSNGEDVRDIRVVCATRGQDKAQEALFAPAFVKAVENEAYGGERQAYLSLDGLIGDVNGTMKLHGQQAVVHSGGVVRGCRALPNPRYQSAVGRQARERRSGKGLLTTNPEYWSGLAGEASDDRFVGRQAIIDDLSRWLTNPGSGDVRTRVITGAAGSGKSTLLGRLVHLAGGVAAPTAVSPQAPLAGTLDVAMLARRKSALDLRRELCACLGLKETGVPALFGRLDELHKDKKVVTVLVDALDEADRPEQIAEDLLSDLSAHPAVRLLVAGRRDEVRDLASDAEVTELDDGTGHESDVLTYVMRRLAAVEGWVGHGQPHEVRALAEEISRRAKHNFLSAHLQISNLLPRLPDLVYEDLDNPSALVPLVNENDALFLNLLERMDPEHPERAQDLLVPLALAEGSGLPWENLWPAIARQISGRQYGDDDVRWVREKARDYIVEELLDGESVYRLSQDTYVRALRKGLDLPTCHERIASVLTNAAIRLEDGTRDWMHAHSYTRAHLPQHLVEAKSPGSARQRDELLSDPRFLVAAEPSGLVKAVPAPAPGDTQHPAASIYRWAADYLADAPRFGDRASFLELGARYFAAHDLAERFAALDLARQWRVPWVNWRTPTPHLPLGYHRAPATAMADISWRGSSSVLAVFSDGMARMWSADDGVPLLSALATQQAGRRATALAMAELDGAPVAVLAVGSRLEVWDPRSDERRLSVTASDGEPVRGLAVTHIDGMPVAACGDRHGVVRVYALADGHLVRGPFVLGETGHGLTGLWALEPREGIGEPLLVGADNGGGLAVWKTATDEPLWSVTTRVVPQEAPVAVLADEGLLLFGHSDGSVDAWNVLDQRRWRELRTGSRPIRALSALTLDDRTLVAVGGDDSRIRLYDLHTNLPCGPVLQAHTGAVSVLHLTRTSEGRPVLVSGGIDRAVLRWEPDLRPPAASGDEAWDRRGQGTLGRLVDSATRPAAEAPPGATPFTSTARESPAEAVAAGRLAGRVRAVSGHRRGAVQVWDAVTGTKVSGDPGPSYDDVTALTVAELDDGEPLTVVGDRTGHLLAWRLDGERVGLPMRGHRRRITDVVVGTQDRRPAVISASEDGDIRIWCALRGVPLPMKQDRHEGHDGPVLSLAIGPNSTQFVSGGRDGTLRLWNTRGQRLDRPRQLKQGPVTALAVATHKERTLIAYGTESGHVGIVGWRVPVGQEEPERSQQPMTLSGHGEVKAIDILWLSGTPKKPVVVFGHADGTLHLYDFDMDLWRGVPTRSALTDLAAVPGHDAVLVSTRQGMLSLNIRSWPWEIQAGETTLTPPVARKRGRRGKRGSKKNRKMAGATRRAGHGPGEGEHHDVGSRQSNP
ncbi:caspase family protein [Streptomyces sp. NPDC051896]|uniref:caspase family protein n=1 Tax=Streptomyces sp. NPDC051896 TaxID=3155416 RepID=UPI0034214293